MPEIEQIASLVPDVLPPGVQRGGNGGHFVSVQGQGVQPFPLDVNLLDKSAELIQSQGPVRSYWVLVLETK